MKGQVQSFVNFFSLSHSHSNSCHFAMNEDGGEAKESTLTTIQAKLVNAETAKRSGNTNAYYGATMELAKFFETRDLSASAYFYQQCLEICKERGDHSNEIVAYYNLGRINANLGDLLRAIEFHELQMQLARDMNVEKEKHKAAEELTQLYLKFGTKQITNGANKTAVQFLLRGLESARAIKDRDAECTACERLGHAYSALGDEKHSVLFVSEHHKLRTNLDAVKDSKKSRKQLSHN